MTPLKPRQEKKKFHRKKHDRLVERGVTKLKTIHSILDLGPTLTTEAITKKNYSREMLLAVASLIHRALTNDKEKKSLIRPNN